MSPAFAIPRPCKDGSLLISDFARCPQMIPGMQPKGPSPKDKLEKISDAIASSDLRLVLLLLSTDVVIFTSFVWNLNFLQLEFVC